MAAPDLTQKVLGFREFFPLDGKLMSLSSRGSWTPGVNKAYCLTRSLLAQEPTNHGSAPWHDCQCGLYGWHQPIRRVVLTPHQLVKVWAAILAWGHIEVHHDGFRAEFAEILLLETPEHAGTRKRAEECASVYGVEMVPTGQLMTRAERIGHVIPDQLKPTPRNCLLWMV